MKTSTEKIRYLDKFTARKVQDGNIYLLTTLPDSLDAWITQYLQLAVIGVRSPAVMQKIALQLARFLEYFRAAYGHDRISTCLKRDVVSWQKHMQAEDWLTPRSIITGLTRMSNFFSWVPYNKFDKMIKFSINIASS